MVRFTILRNFLPALFFLLTLFSFTFIPHANAQSVLPEFKSRCQFPTLKTKAKALAEKTKHLVESNGFARAAVIVTTRPESVSRPQANYEIYLNDLDVAPVDPNNLESLKFSVTSGTEIDAVTPVLQCEATNVTFSVNVMAIKELPDGTISILRDRQQTVIPKILGTATR